jgi:predicted transcriptional regulator
LPVATASQDHIADHDQTAQDPGCDPGHTFGMKTAVSLPDEVFQRAERLGKRLRKSRSALYGEAIAEYLARHDPDEITEALNAALAGGPFETPEEGGWREAATRAWAARNKW